MTVEPKPTSKLKFVTVMFLSCVIYGSEVDRGGARGAMAPPIIVPRPGNPEQVTNTM